jgi:hypothetical protein
VAAADAVSSNKVHPPQAVRGSYFLRSGAADKRYLLAHMNSTERAPFLQAIDVALVPLGFKRLNRGYEWKRSIDSANLESIHCNFGLEVINPSLGVRYKDLEEAVPADLGAVVGVADMLESITGISYSSKTNPQILAEHLLSYAIPELVKLRDRNIVISMLEEDIPKKWPVFGTSARIRLLPLLLAQRGRVDDARRWLLHFEQNAQSMDQQLPAYPVFASYLRTKYGC